MPDQGSSQYGPFLIMQYGGVLLVLIGLAFAVYRGTRDRRLLADQESSTGMAYRWFYPPAGLVLRRGRIDADLRPRLAFRADRVCIVARPHWTPCENRKRRGDCAAHDCRSRSHGLH